MTSRLCWMLIDPLSRTVYQRLVDGIKLDQFSSDLTSGFLVDTLRADYLEARFIQKTEVVETIVDPFGNEQITNRVDYTQLHFRLQKQAPHLELSNPPRQINSFLTRLGEFTHSESSIYSPALPVDDWLTQLGEHSESLTVTGALISDMEIGESVLAKIALSGERDVREFITALTGRRSYVLSQAAVSLVFRGKTAKLVIKPEGRFSLATHSADVATTLREHMRPALEKR